MRKYLGFISMCCILILLAGCRGDSGTQVRVEASPSHPSFLTTRELNAVLASWQQGNTPVEGRVVSAVVPHHLVAGRLIAAVLEVLARQDPAIVVVVGPNHFNKGGKVITGLYGWETPGGIVEAEGALVKSLVDKGLAVRDEEVLSKEHSIGALVPLIRHFLPKARIVPIILHHDVNLKEVDAILEALKPFLGEKAVLISSVDFSHYLTRSQAQAKDQDTLRYMRDFDYSTLFRLGNDYLDSPASLAAAFRLAQGEGIKEFSLLENTNSGIIMKNDVMETTSYFTLVFCK